MPQHKLKVIISGGGTGGHIFPAVAIAEALKEKDKDVEILFIGAQGKMEMEKIPGLGYPIEGLWISGLQRSLSAKNMMFPVKVVASIIKARKIIRRFNPDVVVGVGGFASGPALRAATGLKIPTLIQEQNSYPGITNKLLAKSVQKICVAFDGMEKFFPKDKLVMTGNPIRKDVVDIENKRSEALKFFNLSPERKTILAVGGSLGARSINRGIYYNAGFFAKTNLQLIWQTGKFFTHEAAEKASEYDEFIQPYEFIDRMDLAYAAADIVISRAGAIAISELCAVARPSILVPLPIAAEDHQTKNARALSEKDAAILLPDLEVNDKLTGMLKELSEDEDRQGKLTKNIRKLAHFDAASKIADEVIKLSKTHAA